MEAGATQERNGCVVWYGWFGSLLAWQNKQRTEAIPVDLRLIHESHTNHGTRPNTLINTTSLTRTAVTTTTTTTTTTATAS